MILIKWYKAIKSWFYMVVQKEDDHWLSKAFDVFIISLILSNVSALILETVDGIYEPYKYYFHQFDLISIYIFTVEYLLRIWVITDDPKYKHPIIGRLRYIFSFSALIDLGAVLPFYLPKDVLVDGRMLRIIRILRIFRVFKFNRYSSSAELIGNVFRERKVDLLFSFGVAMMLLLMVSSLMYFVEHDAQPEQFSSIPATLWWGIATLTTVGYGDVYPITALGKFLGGIMAVLGVGVFALPAGILANGFGEEIRKRTEKLKNKEAEDQKIEDEKELEHRKVMKTAASHLKSDLNCPHCGEPLELHSTKKD